MKKNIVKSNPIKLILFLFFVSLNMFSQNLLSVPFTAGFIGVQGSNTQQAKTIKTFTTLGIAKAFFMQNSASTTFQVQGNDAPGTLRLQLNSGQLIDIPGGIVWKDGATVNYLGFIPNAGFSSASFSYGALTYTITTSSNIGLGLIGGSTADFTDGRDITGNASGFDTALNNYLAQTNLPANKPSGPVTVTALTTTSTSPTIMGTVTLGAGESLSIEVNNVLYTTANGLSIAGTNWSLPMTVDLANGTYSIVAKITNSSGYTLNDTTSNEIVIGVVETRKFVSKTGQDPNDTSTHVNKYGEIGISSLSVNGEDVYYVPKFSGASVLVSSTATTATLESTIVSSGGTPITAKGVCWSTTTNPTTANDKTDEGTGKGTFSSTITGLTSGATYFVRAYATNKKGTSYGFELSFTK